MKKLIISAALLLLTGATAFAVNQYTKSLNNASTDPLLKANIEAMRTHLPFKPDIDKPSYDRIDCMFKTLANCPMVVVTPTGTIIKDHWHFEKKTGWI